MKNLRASLLIPGIVFIVGVAFAAYWFRKTIAVPGDTAGEQVQLSRPNPAGAISIHDPVKLEVRTRSMLGGGGLRRMELVEDGQVVQVLEFPGNQPAEYRGELQWYPSAPGPHELLARAVARSGPVAESKKLQLSALKHRPPELNIYGPKEKEVYQSVRIPLGIGVTAFSREGKVTRVEYFLRGEKIGENTKEPYSHTITHPPDGDYEVMVRATDDQGATTEQVRRFMVKAEPLYATSFLPIEGFLVGRLQPRSNWEVSGPLAEIVPKAGPEGQPALQLPAAGSEPKPSRVVIRLGRWEPGSRGVLYYDFLIRPVADQNIAAASRIQIFTTKVALLRQGQQARVQVEQYPPSENERFQLWKSVGKPVPLDSDGTASGWLRITVRYDMEGEIWDLYVDGRMVLHDEPFYIKRDDAISLTGHRAAPVLVSRVSLQTTNPLFRDSRENGIDDAWEEKYQLHGSRIRRYLDTDHDGATDIEEYMQQTDPTVPDTDHEGAPIRPGSTETNDGSGTRVR